ncbi:MAG: four helix bundle protein [Anaerolineae bacterium]|nr:four helix bundle protein [Candidatus Roseilinea sp.]MDW8449554.1 four helix bundle protein [Anaerolineae bacterium]
MIAKDHRELRVCRLAFESALEIHKQSAHFPPEEKYSLTDQIRRSSRSICANIAEAWRKRRYPNSFVSKLSDADSESAEVLVWLEFALSFGYITNDAFRELNDRYAHISSQLALMMAEPEKWKHRERTDALNQS